MTSAKGLVLQAPRTFKEQSFPLPTIGDDDGLLRLEACGLCGTDHEQYTGMLSPGYAFIPGHEIVGTIEEIGSKAAQRWGVAKGDRVAVEVFQSCHHCPACENGTYRRCEKHGIMDMYGFSPADKPPGLWGGYAEYVYLSSDALVLKMPTDMDPVIATLFNPIGAGVRWGVELPELKKGDVVAVLGPGIRGIAASAAAKAAGASFVLMTGLGPQDTPRLELAKRFGVDRIVDVAKEDPSTALNQELGRLADIVVDVTAKAPAAFGQAVDLARPGGTIVMAGVRGSTETPGLMPDMIVYKELRILGALGVDVGAYKKAIDLIAANRYPFAELPRRTAGFKSVARLLEAMAGEHGADRPVHGVFVPQDN
jgi:alcohol dehydrogenase